MADIVQVLPPNMPVSVNYKKKLSGCGSLLETVWETDAEPVAMYDDVPTPVFDPAKVPETICTAAVAPTIDAVMVAVITSPGVKPEKSIERVLGSLME